MLKSCVFYLYLYAQSCFKTQAHGSSKFSQTKGIFCRRSLKQGRKKHENHEQIVSVDVEHFSNTYNLKTEEYSFFCLRIRLKISNAFLGTSFPWWLLWGFFYYFFSLKDCWSFYFEKWVYFDIWGYGINSEGVSLDQRDGERAGRSGASTTGIWGAHGGRITITGPISTAGGESGNILSHSPMQF